MNEIKDIIRQFILSNYLPGEPRENLHDDTPLQTGGILDSLATLKLVTFIEQQFHVEMDVYDASVERFDRIEEIAASVMRKQARGALAADPD